MKMKCFECGKDIEVKEDETGEYKCECGYSFWYEPISIKQLKKALKLAYLDGRHLNQKK